jgi:hypothetical protein
MTSTTGPPRRLPRLPGESNHDACLRRYKASPGYKAARLHRYAEAMTDPVKKAKRAAYAHAYYLASKERAAAGNALQPLLKGDRSEITTSTTG